MTKTNTLKNGFKRLALTLAIASGVAFTVNAEQAVSADEMSYQQALDKMQAESAKRSAGKERKSPLTDQDRVTMKEFNEYLAATMPNPGIAVGEKAPSFTLVNANGMPVSLKRELRKGPVVLVFYRGSWCPYCNLHLNVLQKAKPELDKYNAQVIAVTPQQPDRSAEQVEKDGFPFQVLSDISSKVMKDYKLYFELSDEMQKVYSKFNLDLEAYNGAGRFVLPVPGTFVIGQDGKVVAMEAQVDYKSRMEPAEIIAALKTL